MYLSLIEELIMDLKELQILRDTNAFHHATYRQHGTVWEGLWIYIKKDGGFRGYDVAGCFYKHAPELEAAHEICRGTGISVGAYGRG